MERVSKEIISQLCASINIPDRFIQELLTKFEICERLPSAQRACESFTNSVLNKGYSDERWSFYRIMLTLDLLSVVDILYAHTDLILDFVERLYAPYHYTSYEKNWENKADSSADIAQFLIEKRFKDTSLFLLLKLMIGLHLDIKEQSLLTIDTEGQQKSQTRQDQGGMVWDSDLVYEKYRSIKKLMKTIYTNILVFQLGDEDFNCEIETEENRFLEMYSKCSEQFLKGFRSLKLVLELEQVANAKYPFHALGVGINFEEKLGEEHIKRLKRIVKEIEGEPIKDYYELLRINLEEPGRPFERIDLLKFKALELFLYNYEFPPSSDQEYQLSALTVQTLLKIEIFTREKSVITFTQLRNEIKLAFKNRIKGEKPQTKSFFSLINSDLSDSPCQILKSIFYKIDIQIAGLICEKWRKEFQAQNHDLSNIVIICGSTGVGKSSFINFLANKYIAETGTNRESTTFYPKLYKIRKNIVSDNIPREHRLTFCDTPGLMDNRTTVHKLCVCFFLTHIIKKSSHLKFVYLDKMDMFRSSESLCSYVKIFGNVLSLIPKYAASLFTVYVKEAKMVSKDKIEQNSGITPSENEMENLGKQFKCEKRVIQGFFNALINQMTKLGAYGQFTVRNERENNKDTHNYVSPNSEGDELEEESKRKKLISRNENNEKNRATIIKNLSQMKCIDTSSFDFNPIVFLGFDHKTKIMSIQNQIQQQIQEHLENSDTDFDKFLEFYNVIATFKEANKETRQKIEEVYGRKKEGLEREYQGKHQKYIHFKRIDYKERYIGAEIEQVIKEHVKECYYRGWKDGLRGELKGILRKEKWIFNKILDVMTTQLEGVAGKVRTLRDTENRLKELSPRRSSSTKTQQSQFQENQQIEQQRIQKLRVEIKQQKLILSEIQSQRVKEERVRIDKTFEEYKMRIQQQDTKHSRCLEYLELICLVSRSRVSKSKQLRIIQLQVLIKQQLKSQQLLELFKQPCHELKLTMLCTNKSITHLQKIFLTMVNLYYKNKKNITQELLETIKYYLELLLRESYERISELEYKKGKLLRIENQPEKLNQYGECYCASRVKLSDILKINFRCEKNVYSLAWHKEVKIYCGELEFDVKDAVVKCESLTIVANTIICTHKDAMNSVKFVNFDGESTLLILVSKDRNVESLLRSQINHQSGSPTKKYKLDQSILSSQQLLPPPSIFTQEKKQGSSIDKKPIDSECIKSATLISRTRISQGQFLEKFQIIPHFHYIICQDQPHIPKRRIYMRRNYSQEKLLEFGELHLKRLLLLDNKKQDIEITQYYQKNTEFQRQLIESVIHNFSMTSSLSLKYELCSTQFCQKIIVLINQYHKKNSQLSMRKTILFTQKVSCLNQEDQQKIKLYEECCNQMKDYIFTLMYKYMVDSSLARNRYGRNYIQKFGSEDISAIESYCEDFLTMPLILFKKKYQEEKELLKLTKKFIFEYESRILFVPEEELSYWKVLKGKLEIFFNSFSDKSKDINLTDLDFIKQEIENEETKMEYLQGGRSNRQYKFQNSIVSQEVSSDNSCIQLSRLEKFAENTSLTILRKRFGEIISKYQSSHGYLHRYRERYHKIHNQIGYCYLQRLQFQKAQEEFSLLPSKIDHMNSQKILFDLINNKYKSKEKKLLERSSTQIIQKSTSQYYRDEMKQKLNKSSFKADEIDRSLALRENRLENTWNIISFDSAQYRNDVVNILFAAEIEKTTHRPIMHMFDTIVSKNSSTFIASALSVPQRVNRHYDQNIFKPCFSAEQFLKNSTDTILNYSQDMTLVTQFYTCSLFDLPIEFIAVNQCAQDLMTVTRSSCKKPPTGKSDITLDQIVKRFVNSKRKQRNTNPLLNVYNSQLLPVASTKSSKSINIVSLGSGIASLQQPNIVFDVNKAKGWSKLNRWQVTFDSEVNIKNLEVEDWIEHGRMLIEEKWIENAKEMRDMFDDLEDRSYREEYLKFNH